MHEPELPWLHAIAREIQPNVHTQSVNEFDWLRCLMSRSRRRFAELSLMIEETTACHKLAVTGERIYIQVVKAAAHATLRLQQCLDNSVLVATVERRCLRGLLGLQSEQLLYSRLSLCTPG